MLYSDKYFNYNNFRNCILMFPQAITKHCTCLFHSSTFIKLTKSYALIVALQAQV